MLAVGCTVPLEESKNSVKCRNLMGAPDTDLYCKGAVGHS